MIPMIDDSKMLHDECQRMACYECPISRRERCRLWAFYTNELLRTENILKAYRDTVPEVPADKREGLLLIIANIERLYNSAQELAMYSLPRALLLLACACMSLLARDNRAVVDVWVVIYDRLNRILREDMKGGDISKH